MNRRRLFLALAVTGVLLVPIPRLRCPDWDVWVVDDDGNAIEGMNVHLDYQDYWIESSSHEKAQITDASGHVRFSAVRTPSSAAAYIFGTVRSFGETGVHASFGRHAFLVAFRMGRRGYSGDWTGSPSTVRSRIIAR